MGGFFGAALREDVAFDLFYGTDYHSHLGTRRAGMALYDSKSGFDRAIHNIESSNFRPKFEKDLAKMKGNLGIGCISDYEPQPLIVRSHHGTYAITTVGRINNIRKLTDMLFGGTHSHFLEMSGGDINPTEMVASLINQKKDILEGIKYAQDMIEGSMTFLIMTPKGIYASRDKWGRTPCVIGKKDTGYCVCFESFSFLNLGYTTEKELGPGEVVFIDPEGYEVKIPARREMRICSFLWIYYGFPASSYEGLNVEDMRYGCGRKLRRARHWLREQIKRPLFETVCEIYAHMAQVLYADSAEQERPDRQDEADPDPRTDRGQKTPPDRRFHCQRHSAQRDY